MSGEFQGRSVNVTVAGRGLGRGIAEAFDDAGANAMITARTVSFAKDATNAIQWRGGVAGFFKIDVKMTKPAAVLSLKSWHASDRWT